MPFGRPFRAISLCVSFPGLKPWASMKPTTLSRPAGNLFLFIFDSFWPTSDNTSPVWLWCLIFAVRGLPSAAMINAKVSDCFQRAT